MVDVHVCVNATYNNNNNNKTNNNNIIYHIFGFCPCVLVQPCLLKFTDHTWAHLLRNGRSTPRQWPQKSGQQSDTVRLQNRSQ